LGAVIFGTDQGTAKALLPALLEDAGQPVEGFSFVPSSVAGITPKVQDTLIKIESWNQEKGLDHIYLFYSMQTSAASYQPHTVHLLPMDKEWLLTLKAQPWPSRSIPLFTMEWSSLFSSLIREYLFVSSICLVVGERKCQPTRLHAGRRKKYRGDAG
jgi:F-type H+-transporting ATPase subunit gamma